MEEQTVYAVLKADLIAYLDQYEDGEEVHLDVIAEHLIDSVEEAPQAGQSGIEPEMAGTPAVAGSIVTVLHICTRHGDDYCTHANREGALEHLAAYVREYWEEISDLGDVPDEAPESDEEAIDIYFENHSEEYYGMDTVEIQP